MSVLELRRITGGLRGKEGEQSGVLRNAFFVLWYFLSRLGELDNGELFGNEAIGLFPC